MGMVMDLLEDEFIHAWVCEGIKGWVDGRI